MASHNNPVIDMPCCSRYGWILLLGMSVLSQCSLARAAEPFYPLDHRAPVGVAGRWSTLIRPQTFQYPQTVRVSLPSSGEVTFYSGPEAAAIAVPAPANVALAVGQVYRFRIAEMPEYPNVELFPSVEVLERLHPPEGLAEEFPIPIDLTAEEIEMVLQERMVTKVIYLEDPMTATPVVEQGGTRVEDLPPTANLLQVADRKGRPMAIVRIGGRVPDVRNVSDEFFPTAPVQVLPSLEESAAANPETNP